MAYKLSAAGLEDLKKVEGVRYAVYDDKTGKPINSYEEAKGTPTIGMGLAIQDAAAREKYRPYLGGKKAPPNVMDEANRQKVAQFESSLNKQIGNAILTESMFDAIFHFAWNVGTGSQYVKRIAEAVNLTDAKGKPKPDYQAAQKAIADGPKSGVGIGYMEALAKRRAKEAELFLRDGIPKGLAILKSPKFYWTASALGSVGLVYWILKRNKVI
jgi:GH24 family phage-related lysozyme (muramidase)